MKIVLKERGVKIDTAMRYKLEGISYCSHEIVGSWVNNNMDISVDDLVDVLVSFYPDDLRPVFDNPLAQPDTTLVEILFGSACNNDTRVS